MTASADDARSGLDAAAASWLVRRKDGLTAAEEASFQAWLSADPAHRAALGRTDATWSRLDRLPVGAIDALRAGLPVPARHRPRVAGIGALVPRAAVAAVAAGVLVAGGWLGWNHWQQQPTYAHTFTTPRGQLQEVTLPDGSRVKLDTATRTDVALYRHRREVRLPEGQALFSVHGDPRRPFDVLAGPLRITAVGTRFSVRHTRTGLREGGPGGVCVVVEEGRVRVLPVGSAEQPTSNSDALELTAGHSVSADAQGRLATVVRVPAGAASPWQELRVNFDDTPLAQAVAEFERYADTRLVVIDPTVAAMRLNGSFDLRQFRVFVHALPQVLPVRLRKRPDGSSEVERAG